MRKIYTFLSLVGLVLLLLPAVSKGQGCDNKVTVAVGGLGVRAKPGSTGVATYDYCPDGSNTVVVSGSTSTAGSTLTWTATSGNGAAVPISSTSTTDKNGTYSTISVAPIANTTYTLSSASGCNGKVTDASIAIVPTLAVSASVSPVCSGASTVLTATGSSTGQYTWTAPGMATTTNSGTLTVMPTVTTTYTVTSTTSACGTATQQITVSVKSVTIAPSAPSVCAGQSVTLTASYSGTSVTSYKWYNVAAPSTVLSTASTYVASPSSTATYRVEATTSDCSTVTQQVTVTVGSPTITVSPASAIICSGSSTTLTASSNNVNTTFSWKPATGLNAATGPTVTAKPTATTTYTLTATTCGSTIDKQVIVTVAAATYGVTPNPASVCSGNATTLTASSNISDATYKWYEGTASTTVISISPTLTVSPTANTTYRAVITTSCGSSGDMDVPVTVNAKPTITVASSASTIKQGESVTLTAGGGNSYTWTATVNGATTYLQETTASIKVAPASTTTYTVTGATSATGCSNAAQATITVSGVLPVALIDFQATWAAKHPKITWATASEKDNAYFEVERSLDGQGFQAVGRRAGAGTHAGRTDYQFSDVSLTQSSATVYYRLRQVDGTGEVSYSNVQAVQSPTATQAFRASVFPNPYEKKVTVQFEAAEAGATTLILFDVFGKIVLSQDVTTTSGRQEEEVARAASLPAGVYYLTIRQGQRQQVLKVVHQ